MIRKTKFICAPTFSGHWARSWNWSEICHESWSWDEPNRGPWSIIWEKSRCWGRNF